MPNLFVDLPLPAGNGAGAAVGTSGMGNPKTIVVAGTFPGATITIEASVDGGVVFAPIPGAVFQTGDDELVVDVAAQFMRVFVAGRKASLPFAANIDVGAPGLGGLFTAIPLPAGNGPGIAIDVSALGSFSTFITGGVFPGATITIEASEDGVSFAPILSFAGQGGLRSEIVTQAFVRANVSGRKATLPFTATLAMGAINDPVGIAGINVSDEGAPIGPGPFTELNFLGPGVVATDAGGGVADITIFGVGTWNVVGPFTSVGAPHPVAIDDLAMANMAAGAFSFTLPAVAAANSGGQIAFKKLAGGPPFTITPSLGNTIEGFAVPFSVPGVRASVTLVSDGVSNWMVI